MSPMGPDTLAVRFDQFVDETSSLLTSPIQHNRDDAAAAACGIWRGFPLLNGTIESSARDPEGKHFTRERVAHLHCLATDRLMHEAERAELNSAPLREEARVCRELFRGVGHGGGTAATYPVNWFHCPHRDSDEWPACIGEWRYMLPPAMQEAIRQGEEVFERLIVRYDISHDSSIQDSAKLKTGIRSHPGGDE